MFIISIISIIIYLIATLTIWTNIYEFEKEKKIKFIISGIAIIFIITWIIVLISSGGIQVQSSYLKIAKTTSLLIFAPINTILAVPYLGNMLNKYKQNRINEQKLKKRLLAWGIVLLVIVIFEINYINTFEIGLLRNVIK